MSLLLEGVNGLQDSNFWVCSFCGCGFVANRALPTQTTRVDRVCNAQDRIFHLAISSADLPVCSINLPVHPPGCPFIQFGVLEILSVAPLPQGSQEVGPIPEDVLLTVMANGFYSPQNAF